MESPQILHIKATFPMEKQYIVPSYQRNYAWSKTSHWEPLWWDVFGLAEQIRDPERSVTPHFLGTIITKKIRQDGLMELWWVVDGQQRLTTLQVLLAASRAAFGAAGLDLPAKRLSSILENSSAVVNRPEDRYKITHKSLDHTGFRNVIDHALGVDEVVLGNSALETCYSYYFDIVCAWLNEAPPKERGVRAIELIEAMLIGLQFVDIRLDKGEDGHAIFESLNARGAPLTEWEKTKNYLLSLASRVRLDDRDGDLTYHRYLQEFDDEHYWNHVVSAPRFKGRRVEHLLFYFAQLEIPDRNKQHVYKKPISKDHIYRIFRDWGEKAHHSNGWDDLSSLLESFQRYASIYQRLQDKTSFSTAAQKVLRHCGVMQIGSLFPLVMELVAKLGDGLEFDDAMAILDSYLMRRLAGRVRHSGFDNTAFYYMRVLRTTPRADIHRELLGLLEKGTANTRWPTDKEMLIDVPLATSLGGIAKVRLEILLEAIAERMHRDSFGDTYALIGAAKLGQVAPPEWERHWHQDMRVGYSEEDRIRLNRMTSRMGNLTLLGNPKDKSLVNHSWPHRAEQLEQDDLEMNRRIVADMEEATWGEDSITRRGLQIAQIMTRLWPHAEVFRERLGIER